MIAVLLVGVVLAADSPRIPCAEKPPVAKTYWSWREIDGRKCWFEGRASTPKSQLFWAPQKVRLTDKSSVPRAKIGVPADHAMSSELLPFWDDPWFWNDPTPFEQRRYW